MTSSFKIHEDENPLKKVHETKSGSSIRQVLGDIKNNFSRTHLHSKREPLSDSISTGFIENIKALGLKDKSNHEGVYKALINLEVKEANKKNSTYIHTSENSSEQVGKENISVELSPIHKSKSLNSEPCYEDKGIPENEDLPENDNIPENEDIPEDEGYACEESPEISKLELSKTTIDHAYSPIYYKEDIYEYMKKMEKEYQASAYYMRRQPEITHSMRTILVDWLVEVGEEYSLAHDTLFMAISLIDRFLSVMAITKAKLQLLGTSAMLIASKYEEVYPPEVGAFVYITDDSYTSSQVIRMERLILKVLHFDVSKPTAYTFLMHILSYESFNVNIVYLSMYLCELTLLQAEPYLQFYPSQIASSCIALARYTLKYTDMWPSNLVRITGYTLVQLAPIINHLNETHEKSFTSSHQAIRQKYSIEKYREASKVPFKKLVLRESL